MVRHIAVFFILGLSIAFAQKEKGEKRSPAGKQEPAVNAVPAGAAEISPGLFKHTDGAGKTWLYRKTPFGVVKSSDDQTATSVQSEGAQAPRANPFGGAKAGTSAPPLVTAVEEGDSYKFERNTPFGPARWTRKKSELTADEQEIVERSRKAKSETTGSKE
jgi:hypothetical protein